MEKFLKVCISWSLILLIFSCNSKNNSDKEYAEIDLLNNNLDLGTVRINDTINIQVQVKNESHNYEYRIEGIESSCGCVLVDADFVKIKAGDLKNVKLYFIPYSKGVFKKSVVIKGNTKAPFSVFTFYGNASD